MRADHLDAALEPFAQLGLIALTLVAFAGAGAFFLITWMRRRNDRKHQKVSGSKRCGDTGIDLFSAPSGDKPRSRRR